MSDERIPVVVLGATGSVGQRFVRLLGPHPWFRIVAVTASERSAGRPYGEAVRWVQDEPPSPEVAALQVLASEPETVRAASGQEPALAFSALDAEVAGEVEVAFAREGMLVVSNARNHRMDPDVPLLVPEVNPEHLELLGRQGYGEGGGILTNPNCSTIGLSLALAPLHRAFGVRQVHVVTLQAVSGAGLPGVPSAEILDNVIPFIPGEEEKMEGETRKVLGTLEGEGVRHAEVTVSAQCNRVPVLDGHLASVSVALERPVDPGEAREALASFRGPPQELALPTAPRRPVHVLPGEAEPQPRLHRDLEGGMAVSVGRLRPCPVLDLRFVVLSHNTVRGAAGGALLCAELAGARGRVRGVEASWLSGS